MENRQKMSVITVVRNPEMYEAFVRRNKFVNNCSFYMLNNRKDSLPIPILYNEFLNSYDYSQDAWFFFCHEDFELREDVSVFLDVADKSALHGVVGGARRGFAGFGMQIIYGNMTEQRRHCEGEEWSVGKYITQAVEVEAFDCCCLIVHSSLIQKFHLRFDEHLLFDLYVEDFCAMAKVSHGIRSFVHPVKCCHHSGSCATERLYRHLPYLRTKYPHNCFVGTLVYFGTPSWQKRLQDWMMALLRKLNRNAY